MGCNQLWEPNNGPALYIHDMADSHLRNAYALLLGYEDEGWGEEDPWDGQPSYNHARDVLLPALEEEFERRGMVARGKRDLDEMFRKGGRVG